VGHAVAQPTAAVEPARRILVCDDERRLAELTAGLLRHFGFDAVAVVDGESAVRAASQSPGFDVLILDLSLVGLSSEQVLSRLSTLRHAPRVVLTSGYGMEDVPAALMRGPNVVGYLPKPYQTERLVESVRGALADRD